MRKLLGYLPFHFLLCLIAGILLQYSTDVWSYDKKWLWCGLLLLIILLIVNKRTWAFQLFTWFFFLIVGVYCTYQSDDRNHSSHYKDHITKDSVYVLHIREVLKPNQFSNRYKAALVQVGTKKTQGKVLLNIKKEIDTGFIVDDQIITSAELIEVKPPLNPHQFNYKSYLAKQGIHHQLFLEEFIRIEKIHTFTGKIAGIRKKIQNSLKEEGFSKDEFGVINALLLGQRQELSKELISNYSKAGAIHILAVSGLHVGIVLLLLSTLLRPIENFKYGKAIKLLLIVLFLWFFALLAGMSASVVRAVTMFTAVAIGQFVQRRNSIEHSLIFSMFLLLLAEPMFLFDVGFQLSYMVVFGIVSTQPRLYKIWKPKFWLLDKVWQLTTVSLIAQLAVLPLSLYYFHQFPGLFLMSNLIIVPFLGIILLGGVLMIVLSLCSLLPDVLVAVYGGVISSMNSFVEFISEQERFLFSEISFSLWMLLSSYLLILTGVRFFERRRAKRLIQLLCAVLILQGTFLYEQYMASKEKELVVFHKTRSSILAIREGRKVKVYHSLDSVKRKSDRVIESYLVGENLQIQEEQDWVNYLSFKEYQVLLLDSLGIYSLKGLKAPIVVLQNSPRINLKRLIEELRPKQIIADGSNYKSYVTRWEETCVKTKTPFWFTGQNGAYILK